MEVNYIDALGVEYTEFAVRDIEASSKMYEEMQFECLGYRTDRNRKSKLFGQGDIRVVLSTGLNETDLASKFVNKHGDGVLTLAYRVDSAKNAIQIASSKSAKPAIPVEQLKGSGESVQELSAIQLYGDVLNAFVSYSKNGSLEDLFSENRKTISSSKGKMLQSVDHITVNVEKGKVDYWAKFHKELFGFDQVRYFDIRTGRTGLISRALRNPNGRVTMPFNEPTDPKSQIQEFVDTFHGPGVQHIAYHTSNILSALGDLREKGFKFLTVPDTYYDEVPKRVPTLKEDLERVKELGILVDGSDKGYLLQIFTENMVGPFFFEFIQRRGDDGFGEGNFRALFEAIERDQIRRGVLSA
ncbi:MAG: 4-hydroxyphenylpyruvate dioxygenase [Bacteriovoracia bacterium]